jgi:hypothetical protein
MRSTSIVLLSLVGLIAASTIPQNDNSRTNILDLTGGNSQKQDNSMPELLSGNYPTDNTKNNLLTGNSRSDAQDKSRNNVLNGAGKNLDQNQDNSRTNALNGVKGNSVLDITNNNNQVENSPTRADNNRVIDSPSRLGQSQPLSSPPHGTNDIDGYIDRIEKRALLGGLDTPSSGAPLKATTVVSRLTQTGEKALARETGTSGKDSKNGKSQKGGKGKKGSYSPPSSILSHPSLTGLILIQARTPTKSSFIPPSSYSRASLFTVVSPLVLPLLPSRTDDDRVLSHSPLYTL